jgi:hypothetical protein
MRQLERWWHKKYRTPMKGYDDHTHEEIFIEYLEDYYDKHPEEIGRFQYSQTKEAEEDDEWRGDTPDGLADKMKSLGGTVDVSRYKTEGDENLTEDEVKNIISKVGRSLPKVRQSDTIENEFEDDYESLGG